MLFNSLEFAVFFPLVCILYFTLPWRGRTPFLLLASCIFYMAFVPTYILILLVTILIDYFAGIYLEKSTGAARKYILSGSIVATCLVLFVFKYFYFFTHSFVGVVGMFGWKLHDPALSILLPIGLSFHTFQSLSYVVEVFRGNQKAERDFLTYATFVMFFPQLVAGPIERPQNLLHQFHERHSFDYHEVVAGLKRMAWGFFKKLVIADRLALYVNDVYGAPHQHNGLQLTLGTVFFAYQIYCDFSGYSDIAIGSARILGFKLMENFDTPYSSRSIGEFWRRWHISLSTWFRDYVYVPLGGSRVSSLLWVRNILITFGISGLWHGANWTYLIWGLLNGIYLIFGRLLDSSMGRFWQALHVGPASLLRRSFDVGCTFVLICLAWVVFRAHNLSDAAYIVGNLGSGWDLSSITTANFQFSQLPVVVVAIIILEAGQNIRFYSWPALSSTGSLFRVRWALYLAAVFAVILFGVYRSSQFIYFQF